MTAMLQHIRRMIESYDKDMKRAASILSGQMAPEPSVPIPDCGPIHWNFFQRYLAMDKADQERLRLIQVALHEAAIARELRPAQSLDEDIP